MKINIHRNQDGSLRLYENKEDQIMYGSPPEFWASASAEIDGKTAKTILKLSEYTRDHISDFEQRIEEELKRSLERFAKEH